jgi:hypothetical protein
MAKAAAVNPLLRRHSNRLRQYLQKNYPRPHHQEKIRVNPGHLLEVVLRRYREDGVVPLLSPNLDGHPPGIPNCYTALLESPWKIVPIPPSSTDHVHITALIPFRIDLSPPHPNILAILNVIRL